MVRESIAILVVGVVLMAVFLRTRHYGYAIGAAPLFILPAGHLIIRGILFLSKGRFFGIRPAIVTTFADVLLLALSCIAVVLVASKIESKKNKTIYMLTLLGYTVVLGWYYVYSALQGLPG